MQLKFYVEHVGSKYDSDHHRRPLCDERRKMRAYQRLSYLRHYAAYNSVLSVAQSFLLPFTKDEFLSAVLKYNLSIFYQKV